MTNKQDYEPKVSVCIPNYNYGCFLGCCIESVLSQTYQNFELIVVDNCSTDNSEEVVKEYEKKDPRVRFVRNEKNLGMNGNRNRCLELAKGEYVHILSPDDFILRDFLKHAVEVLDDNHDAVLVFYHNIPVRDGIIGKNELYKLSYSVNKPINYLKMVKGLSQHTSDKYFMIGSFVMRNSKNLRSKFYEWDTVGGETAFLINYLVETQGDSFYLPKDLFFFRLHGSNVGRTSSFKKNMDVHVEVLGKLLTDNKENREVCKAIINQKYHRVSALLSGIFYGFFRRCEIGTTVYGLKTIFKLFIRYFSPKDLILYPIFISLAFVVYFIKILILKSNLLLFGR